MANKKSDVSVLVRGLGMGMAFLQTLTEEIVAAGGCEEMVHFLTKDHARPICKKIAEMIVSSPWQVPRSLLERLSTRCSINDNDDSNYVEHDKRYYWLPALSQFGIPTIRFGNPSEFRGERVTPIPDEISNQIVGKPAEYPMIVMWENEPHIVVEILNVGEEAAQGKMFNPSNLYGLRIANAKYFNLEQ